MKPWTNLPHFLGGILLLICLSFYLRFLYPAGDTMALIYGVSEFVDCFRQGAPCRGFLHFPLLQQVPVLVLKLAGLSNEETIKGLIIINLIAFTQLLRSSWRALQQFSRGLTGVFGGLLLSGPLLWYARSSFGEMLAAWLTFEFVLACWRNQSPVSIGVLFILAGISKDTAFPFLFLLGVAASISGAAREGDSGFRRIPLTSLAAGVAGACLLNGGFNYWRYRSPINTFLLSPGFQTPSVSDQASFFAGIWFSPNGGVFLFWPMFGLLVMLSGWAVLRGSRELPSGRERWTARFPYIACCATLFFLTLGFSKWFAPMGWVAWGPRLMIPWIPGIGFILLTSRSELILELFHRRPGLVWFVLAGIALLTLPQFVVLFRPHLMDVLFGLDAAYPKVAILQEDPTYYYRVMHHMLWTKKSVLLSAFSATGLEAAGLLLAAFSCAVVFLFQIRALGLCAARSSRSS